MKLVRSFLLLLAFATPAFAQPAADCPPDSLDARLSFFGRDLDRIPGVRTTVAPDGYERNTVSVAAPRSLEEAADRATRVLDLPHRTQEGPTCGLYALGMVMDYWHAKDDANAAPYVFDADARRPGAANFPPTTEKDLFATAKENGFFAESLRIAHVEGGMFVADELGKLATKFGYRYRRIDGASATDVRASIDRGHPALVGFDVDHDGNPANLRGTRAHWAVVTGYFEYEGERWFTARHGWENKRYLWKASALEASMRQIQPTLGPKIIEVFP